MSSSKKYIKRSSISGIAIGIMALLACEIPFVLAFIGLGGLSASAYAFRPGPLVEMIAIGLVVTGIIALIVVRFLKRG